MKWKPLSISPGTEIKYHTQVFDIRMYYRFWRCMHVIDIDNMIGMGVWAGGGGGGGGGARTPPKFLRSGKNPRVIRAKYKNFEKIMLCPEKF